MASEARTLLRALRFVGHYWRPTAHLLAVVISAVLLAIWLEVQIPTRAAELVEALRGSGEGDASRAAWWLLGTFLAVSLVQQIYLRVWILFAADIMRRLIDDGFARVQRFATDWHVNHFAGSTVRRITRGMWAYDSLADLLVIDLGPSLLLLTGFSIAMFQRDPVLGLSFMAMVAVFLCVTVTLSLRYVAPQNRIANDADTSVGGALADAVTCNPTVKAFGAEAREDARLHGVTRHWQLNARHSWRRSLDTGAIQSFLIIVMLAVLLLVVLRARADGSDRLEDLVFVLSTYFIVNGHLRNIGRQVRDMQRAVNELDDLVEILATPPQIEDARDARPFVIGPGAVDFDAVRFAYPGQPRPVFDGLSVHIRPGERVALVGSSGAGKTTFVKLLQRLHDVDDGAVRVDGQDVRAVSQSTLRAALALVPQEPILFHRTLAENIGYARPDASRAEIEDAARRARAHDFIARLPEGYETLVGERGIKLSGGERQRVAIARAILADAPLLILDEATSSLDSVTEHEIQAAIENVIAGRTAILIAHRLSTIRRVDRILVFDAGEIVEEGTHDALMARADGTYRRLYDMQALGFVDEPEEGDQVI